MKTEVEVKSRIKELEAKLVKADADYQWHVSEAIMDEITVLEWVVNEP